MDKIGEFFQNNLVEAILISVWMLLEYWLGRTDVVRSGSTLETILNVFKKILELFGFKKKAQDGIEITKK